MLVASLQSLTDLLGLWEAHLESLFGEFGSAGGMSRTRDLESKRITVPLPAACVEIPGLATQSIRGNATQGLVLWRPRNTAREEACTRAIHGFLRDNYAY